MRLPVGYGFHPADITEKEFLRFSKTYDDTFFDERYMDIFGSGTVKPVDEMSKAEAEDMVRELLNDYRMSEYITMVINTEEKFRGRMKDEDLLTEIDDFVGIENICFPDGNEERIKRIRNADDFEKIIRSYFPDSKIRFGRIFGGNDWEDPLYGIED